MPHKSEKIKIEGTEHDRRRKLTDDQKEEIRKNEQELSVSKLAEMYEVSRRTIQFILNPEKLVENKKRRKERGGWAQYYDKNKHARYIKDHRDHKQELFLEGKIEPEKDPQKVITCRKIEPGYAKVSITLVYPDYKGDVIFTKKFKTAEDYKLAIDVLDRENSDAIWEVDPRIM